jgi:hypothetical protein
MTCVQSRDEYIAAVEDLRAISRFLDEATSAYVDALRVSPLCALEQQADNRTKMTAAVERLAGAEREALERYRRDLTLHDAPPAASCAALPGDGAQD